MGGNSPTALGGCCSLRYAIGQLLSVKSYAGRSIQAANPTPSRAKLPGSGTTLAVTGPEPQLMYSP